MRKIFSQKTDALALRLAPPYCVGTAQAGPNPSKLTRSISQAETREAFEDDRSDAVPVRDQEGKDADEECPLHQPVRWVC